MAPLRRIIPPALIAAAIAAPVALADPAGKTTLEETVVAGEGSGYVQLQARSGERHVVRRAPGAKVSARREARRRSLVFFGQLTDPQIVDEMSPARVDFIDPAGGQVKSSHRPQEALGPHVFDDVIRNMNANKLSRARARGRFARLKFAITTGDLADNQHRNESGWFTTILDGGTVDPMSGRPVSAENPCGGLSDADVARLNDDVANRRYTGVQDFDDWRGAPADRYAGFWDPDEAGPQGMYSEFPRYPGLLDRAQQPFEAEGLDVPWYVARGNHDGLVQGNAPGSNPLFRGIAVGCDKVFPSEKVDPADFRGKDEAFLYERLSDSAFLADLLAGARKVPPDPDRRIISKAEYKQIVAGNGFQAVNRREDDKSNGSASYYAFSPKKGLRFIALDTVAEGGGQHGNLDHPQYRWLKRELRKANRRKQLVVVYGHHPMQSMISTNSDEDAGVCDPETNPENVGCDVDPRDSTPLHRGSVGKANVRNLFLRYPSVVAYVAGHIHENQVRLYKSGRRAFWEISTASHIDWPHQSRTIEIMNNRNGTLSLFGTLLDSAANVEPPPPGDASAFTPSNLASLARELAWNDPQRSGLPESGEEGSGEGRRSDRNVELLIRDPRRRR